MIKICFVHINGYSVFNPTCGAQIGGVETQFGFLARFLNKEPFKVSYIVGDWGQKNKEVREDIIFFKSFSLEKKFFNIIKAPFLLWHALISANADVYIMSSVGVELGLTVFYCKLYRKKIIYWTAHDIDCNGEYRRKNPFRGRLFEYGIRNANLIVAQNLSHAKGLKANYNIDAIVIKNGFPIKKTNDNEKKYILWVARCESWKNPALFLKLAKMFSDQSFIMICSKQRHEFQLFEKIKREASKIPNLKFIEGVIFSNIQQYFDEAKIFVGTSHHEGFPIVYLHACIAGVPIISYKVNPDNFITDNNVGYCSDGVMHEFEKNIKKLIDDHDDWQEKSKNAYGYIHKNHDMEIIGAKWEKEIKKLAKNNF